MEKEYYTRTEIANYFNISVQTLLKVFVENNIKELYLTFDSKSRGNKTVRTHKTEIEKLEKILKSKK